jgi:hypothetical protein
MPAYSKGDASLESYLVKIIAALCQQNGGSIRVKGELIDVIDQPVVLKKDWDAKKQELVLTANLGSFTEVFIARPEKQPSKEVIAADPIRKQVEEDREIPFDKIRTKGSILDNEKLAQMEATLQKRRIAALLREDMARNARQQREASGG